MFYWMILNYEYSYSEKLWLAAKITRQIHDINNCQEEIIAQRLLK